MQRIFKPVFLVVALGAIASMFVPARAANVVTRADDLGTLSPPQTLTLSHAFNDLDASLPGIQLPGPLTLNSTDTFFDEYAFVVPSSSFSSITATIDLGSIFNITGLSVRLYQGTLATTTTGNPGSAQINAWSTPVTSGNGTVQVIAPENLAPGSYIFEVKGKVGGTSGGAYAGVVNIAAPIPEPNGLALLMAGFGAIGFAAYRRSKVA